MIKFVLLVMIAGAAVACPSSNPEYDALWAQFKQRFQKQYQPLEEASRRLIWDDHVKEINRHNLEADVGIHNYKKGLNEYADLTQEEFVRQMNGYRRSRNVTPVLSKVTPVLSEVTPVVNITLPATVDWRQKGFVTPVKNQKQCASGWAFSTTGSLEGQHMRDTGKLVSLSEQNLVDCSGPEGNHGCSGGSMGQAFDYISKNKGIDTDASYPYTGRDGTCKFNEKKNVGDICIGRMDILHGDEKALQKAVATDGPISVAIEANLKSFIFYKSGIYDDPDCTSIFPDHAVLAVGYGTEDGVDYWLVKNSWGRSWGEKGYIKMSRNKNNQCGIATQASLPLTRK